MSEITPEALAELHGEVSVALMAGGSVSVPADVLSALLLAHGDLETAADAEAERDALRARVAELTETVRIFEQNLERAENYAIQQRRRIAATDAPIPDTLTATSPSDPALIIAGIRQFGLAPDGSDLRDLAFAITAVRAEGFRQGVEEAARVAESYHRDASFDDSQVGAQEHNANQANIARAIRALAAAPDAGPTAPQKQPPAYKPSVTFNEEGGFFEFFSRDTAYIAHEGPNYDYFTDMETGEVVGVRFWPASAAERSEWQPIETAPKDETWLILLFDYRDEPVVCAGFWSEDGGWYGSEADSNQLRGPDNNGPTHWMPLPPPPNDGGA